jgi:hypothetical protein
MPERASEKSLRAAVAAIAAASLLPGVMFLVAADNVMRQNVHDLLYHPPLVLAFVCAFAVTTLVIALALMRSRLARAVAWLCLSVTIFVIVSTFLRGTIGQHQPSLPATIAIDLVCAVAIGGAVFLLSERTLLRLMGIFGAIVVLTTMALHAWWFGNLPKSLIAGADTRAKPGIVAGTRDIGNVYHVILDAYQSELLPIALERHPDLAFPGFRFFARYNSTYPRTDLAIPLLFRGRLYQAGESFENYSRQAHREGFWSDLMKNNVGMWIYPYARLHCDKIAAHCTYAEDTLADLKAGLYRTAIVDFWFLRLLPNSVALWLNGNYAFTRPFLAHEDRRYFSISEWFSRPQAKRSTTAFTDRSIVKQRQLMSVALFDRMLDDEAHRPASGQYVFIHLIIPHEPWSLDENCREVTSPAKDPEVGPGSPVANTICATRLGARLVARLRELGRYHNSMVILQSDHGNAVAFGVDRFAHFLDPRLTLDKVAARTMQPL